MIYARFELWPKGDSTKARVLGEATVANVGGDANFGDFEFQFSKFGGFVGRKRRRKSPEPTLFGPATESPTDVDRVHHPLASSVWRDGLVKHLNRKTRGYLDLFYQALFVAVRDRNMSAVPVSPTAEHAHPVKEPCVFGEFCEFHGYFHGGEAEELRQAIEALRTRLGSTPEKFNTPEEAVEYCRKRLDDLLDEVDARDATAWGEHAQMGADRAGGSSR